MVRVSVRHTESRGFESLHSYITNVEFKLIMEKLLEKVREYGEQKGIGEPSLSFESDGSGG